MARKVVDCRGTPGTNRFTAQPCTLVLAGEEAELLQASVEHGVSAHGYEDTPELRDLIRKEMKEEVTAP